MINKSLLVLAVLLPATSNADHCLADVGFVVNDFTCAASYGFKSALFVHGVEAEQAECFRVEFIRQAYLVDDAEGTRGLTGSSLQSVYEKAADAYEISEDKRDM